MCFFANFAEILYEMRQILFIYFAFISLFGFAQVPTVDPTATYYMINDEGEEETDVIANDTKPLNAPVRIVFNANLTEPCNVKYTWTITNTKEATSEPIIRRSREYGEYEELEMEFAESGSYVVQFEAEFYDSEGDFLHAFPDEGEEPKIINFSISESKLEFPNGISPNGDERNDVLKPKDGYKSIVSFHAAVFNRWGKKLYSWDDVRGSWDGKFNGKVVKDGVYFLVVSAKGSDGIDYNIKKAINVISGYNNGENESGSAEESE